MEEKKKYLPGSVVHIIRHGTCPKCGHEADYQLSEEEFAQAPCEQCGLTGLIEDYIVFPEDGPGFDEGYPKLNLI